MYIRSVEEVIKQRRSQMLIHSFLYYKMDSAIISDHTWQKWADELVGLQEKTKTIGFYDRAFADWDGSSGYHLPDDAWVREKAMRLLSIDLARK